MVRRAGHPGCARARRASTLARGGSELGGSRLGVSRATGPPRGRRAALAQCSVGAIDERLRPMLKQSLRPGVCGAATARSHSRPAAWHPQPAGRPPVVAHLRSTPPAPATPAS
jgi:hypothetical protein